MNVKIPYIQYEVRYSRILNFSGWVRDVVNPFAKVATNISLDVPNSINERITLNFDEEQLQIIVTWDRIIFKCEGEIEKLKHSNSTINTVFFAIVENITNHKSFGTHLNQLLYVTYVNIKDDSKETVYSTLKSNYLTSEVNRILGDRVDFAITLEKNIGELKSNVTFGPYNGIIDLSNRNMLPINPVLSEECNNTGEMAEIKLFNTKRHIVKFESFKKLVDQVVEIKNKVWE